MYYMILIFQLLFFYSSIVLSQVLYEGEFDEPPEIIGGEYALKVLVDEAYPEYARKLGLEGHVVVEVTIDSKGKVVVYKWEYGRTSFQPAVDSILKKITYKPAIKNGKPLSRAKIHQEIDFKISSPEEIAEAKRLAEEEKHKRNIAVLEFEVENLNHDEAFIFTNHLRTELSNTKRFVILDGAKMNITLEKNKFKRCVTQECLLQAGKLLGVEQMVGGSVSKNDNEFSIKILLVDVATGKIISEVAQDIEGDIDTILKTNLRDLVLKLSK